MIAEIDVAPLFGPDGEARRAADRAIMAAASAMPNSGNNPNCMT